MSHEEILQERLDRVAAIVDVIEQHGDLDATVLTQLRQALRWLPDNIPDESQVYGQHSREFGATEKIKRWAKDRGLDTADPAKQMLKLGEECGELCQGMAKGNQEQIIDSIGDIYVVLTVLSLQLGLDIEACIEQAYNEIKDRKGQMIDGVFVKEADLVG